MSNPIPVKTSLVNWLAARRAMLAAGYYSLVALEDREHWVRGCRHAVLFVDTDDCAAMAPEYYTLARAEHVSFAVKDNTLVAAREI